MLLGLFVNGVLIPFLLGIAVALFLAFVLKSRIAIRCFLTGLAVVSAYVSLEGIPLFPPAAVKQKLAYAFLASAVLVSVAALMPRGRTFLLVGLVGGFSLACLYWFAGPVLARATDFGAIIAPYAYTVLASIAVLALLFANGPAGNPAAPRALVRLSAVLAFSIGSAVVAVTGGFIGMGQMFGALAALTGGIVLVGYMAVLRGTSALPARLDSVVPALLLPALATGILVAFYATSLDAVAHGLLPLTLIAGFVLARGSRLDSLPRAIAPIVQGAALALPALLSIIVAFLP